MSLAAPEWLVLLPFLAVAYWRWRSVLGLTPLRTIALVLIVLALSEPRIARGGRGLDLWVLVDRSASARPLVEPRLAEIESLLARGRTSGSRLFVVDYAAEAALRAGTETEAALAAHEETRTAAALRFVLGRLASDRASRLLLVTDGFSTERLAGLGERLVEQRVPLDLRLLTHAATGDVRAQALSVPGRVQPGEPFLVELAVAGPPGVEVPFSVARDGTAVGKGTTTLTGGRATVRFTDRLLRAGAARYTVTLRAPHDPVPGNDEASAWVEAVAGPRALVVTAYRPDPVAAALGAQGFEVETVTDLARLSVGRLSGARVVVLDDVPAYRLPSSFLAALDGFVRLQGGGLLMTGGRNSFGSGGYFQSAIDSLLPVSMELRQEHRKLAVAMAIVLDRSGSMSASVGGGATKMDLATSGAAAAIELLGDQDAVAVFAVDSEAHVVLPLSSLGAERGRVLDIVRRIESGGGGIYVYTGLEAAWSALSKAPQGQRHVILFADAADAEEPGSYIRLLEVMRAGGTTVSVIGLGTETDSDAAFLKDVASRGAGRIFFDANPGSLPALFAQETVAVARSAFLDEGVEVKPLSGWLELAAEPLTGLEHVDGYNLSYLRDGATAAFATADEYAAPLVAFWQRGAGRAAAVSFPMAGPGARQVRAWTGYGDLVQTLGRWLKGEDVPPGVALRTRIVGNELQLDLLHDASWEERLMARPPRIAVAAGTEGGIAEHAWRRLARGHFQATLPLAPGTFHRGAVQIGAQTLPFGPLEPPQGAEWSFDRDRLEELKAVSALSGGEERLDLTQAWEAVPRPVSRGLRALLWVAFLLVLLAEALRVRLAGPVTRRAPTATAAPTPSADTAAGAIDEAGRRRLRLRRAKKA